MSAPPELHQALDRVFDGQVITIHGDHLDHARLPLPVIRAAVEALVLIPDEQVAASKGAIVDLVAIVQGLADRAEDEHQAEQARRN